MHKSRLGAVIIDCQTDDLAQAADFWSAALGSNQGRSDSKYVHLQANNAYPRVIVQKVAHESRVHIDIETDDIEAEVERLQSLGAVVIEKMEKWVVMQAPTNQRFCIISAAGEEFESNTNSWD